VDGVAQRRSPGMKVQEVDSMLAHIDSASVQARLPCHSYMVPLFHGSMVPKTYPKT
jgi:hypothetical protein